MVLQPLIAELDELVSSSPASLADADTIVELQRQLSRLEAVTTRAVAAFDASMAWAVDRSHNAAQWITYRCRLPKATARRQVMLGRHLRDFPVAEAAWLAGDITGAHVGILSDARRPATEAQLAAHEEVLVGQAKSLSYAHFAKLVAYWLQKADPDGTDGAAEAKHDRRHFDLSKSYDGMWFGDLLLDPISGAIVIDELTRLERELFDADWAEARDRLGRKPTGRELRRTPRQRRADALVEMAVRSATAPADGRRPKPLFTILVGYETVHGRICELANGDVVAPGALVPWLDQALVERVVFENGSRVIDVGPTRRLFRGATRRAIEVRDRECYHEYCDVPASGCQVDHIIPFPEGGPTTVDNGRLACGFHNRDRNVSDSPGADRSPRRPELARLRR